MTHLDYNPNHYSHIPSHTSHPLCISRPLNGNKNRSFVKQWQCNILSYISCLLVTYSLRRYFSNIHNLYNCRIFNTDYNPNPHRFQYPFTVPTFTFTFTLTLLYYSPPNLTFPPLLYFNFV